MPRESLFNQPGTQNQKNLRKLTDVKGFREAMLSAAKEGVSASFPLENERYRIDIDDVHYTGSPPRRKDEREAILKDGSLTMSLRGKMNLTNKETGEVVDSKNKLLARVPYVTDQGTALFNGSDYAISNQLRLKPGVYTRVAASGKVEAPVQTEEKGGFKLSLDPTSGDMSIRVQQSKLNLYELMRAMGVSDGELKGLWGKEIFEENKTSADPRALSRIAQKITGSTDVDDIGEEVRNFFAERKVDPKLAKLATGIEEDHVTKDMLKSLSRKLIDISAGKADTDSRDTLYSQKLYTAPLNLKYYMKSHTKPLSTALWKVTNKGSLDKMPAGVFNDSIKRLLYKSGVAQPMEEVSPMEVKDLMSRVVRTGEHGLSKQGIPFEARMVQPSHLGFLDPVRTSESTSVGADLRSAANVRTDDEGNMYTELENAKTGEIENVPAHRLSDINVSLPDQKGNKRQFAVSRGIDYKKLPQEEIDYYLPSPEAMFSEIGQLIPMSSGAGHLRVLMSGKFNVSAVPLVENEAPLVQTQPTSGGESFERKFADWVGAERSPESGTVTDVGDSHVTIKTPTGKRELPLYENRALNRKTQLHQEPIVKEGDQVEEGQIIAKSNFTDDEGTMATGRNMRIGFIPSWRTFEDAMYISEDASKKLTSEHMYQKDMPDVEGLTVGKNEFTNMFPGEYTKEQMDKIGKDGVIKPGSKVEKGDPLILGYQKNPNKAYYYDLRKSAPAHRKEAVEWDKDATGTVTDASQTKEGQRVFIQATKPMKEGDKIAARHGAKGVVTVVPTEEMPRDKEGNPLEMVISPLSIISRQNPSLFLETMLGKLAKRTGETTKMPAFPYNERGELTSFVKDALGRLKENDIEAMETLYDPNHDKDIGEVLTGNLYVQKLVQMSEAKGQARGRGGYSSIGIPTGGQGQSSKAKKISRQPMNSLLAHGAFNLIGDTLKVRGDKNANFWKAMKMGRDPAIPDVPDSHKVLFDLVKGGGINIKRDNNQLHVMPLTDKNIEDISHGEVQNSQMLRRDNLEPRSGGLFSPEVFGGPGSKKWGHITLPEPIPNPAMEKPIAYLTGKTQTGLRRVLKGEEQLNGRDGPSAVKEALSKIDPENEISRIESSLDQMTKTGKDKAVKRLKYLKMLNEYDISPEELMISKVPVISPRSRPVADVPTMDNAVISDPNYLYKDLIDLVREYESDSGELPGSALKDAKSDIYDATKAVFGLGDPVSTSSKQKDLKGVLGEVFGKGAKHSYVQSRIMSRPVDLSGLAVIKPNVNLNMDQVGLPKKQAWEVYQPLIIRQMVKDGAKPTMALKAVQDETPSAERALKKVVDSRPILVNRAPTLHKHSIMAMYPELIEGDSLEISPQLVEPFGADHDGNCVSFDTKVTCKLNKDVLHSSQLGRRYLNKFKELEMKLASDECVSVVGSDGSFIKLPIGEFPRFGEPGRDKNGAYIYEVPEGISVLSYDHDEAEVEYKPVTKLTVEKDVECHKVETRYGREVEVSSNESLCVFDPESFELEDCCPANSDNRLIPVATTDNTYGTFGDSELGWWYGSLISDGWCSENYIGYAKRDQDKRDEFVRIARNDIDPNFTARTYSESGEHENKYASSIKVHMNGPTLQDNMLDCYIPEEEQGDGRGCLYKKVPDKILFNGSKECLLGVFSGLLDGDGTVAWNTAYKNKRFVCKYSTSSESLRDSVKYLAWKLGIRTSVTTTPPRGDSKESYSLSFSIPDVYKIVDELHLVGNDAKQTIKEFIEHTTGNPPKDQANFVPMSKKLAAVLMRSDSIETGKGVYHALSKAKKSNRLIRSTARKIVNKVERCNHSHWDQFVKCVKQDDVMWDWVKDVEKVESQDTYDLEVPDTKVFIIENGLVIYDTMMYHVPVTDKAVEDAREMTPSKNLTSMREDEPVYVPIREFGQGVYLASGEQDTQPVPVESEEDALQKYKRGEIKADTPVIVK